MREILNENGIQKPDPNPDEWYPLDRFIEVLETVEKDVGRNALTKVGEATPQFADWPFKPDSVVESFSGLEEIFNQTHRNVSGDLSFEQLGETKGRIVSTTPYPAAWESGVLKGAAEMHGSKYARVDIVDESGREKTYEISW